MGTYGILYANALDTQRFGSIQRIGGILEHVAFLCRAAHLFKQLVVNGGLTLLHFQIVR